MILSRYHFWLELPIVHHRDTIVPNRPSPFPTATQGRWGTMRNGGEW
jgi:hypothetical protein